MIYAQYRLVWRPATIPMLLPLFWAVVWPILMVTGADPTISGTPLAALWLAATAIPGSVGLILGYSRADLVHSLTSFTLPDLQVRLLRANALTASGISGAIGILMASHAGSVAGGMAFALGAMSYMIGAAFFDEAVSRRLRLLLAGIAAAWVWHAPTVGGALLSWAMIAIPVLLAVAAWVLVALSSRDNARTRPFRWAIAGGSGARPMQQYWARQQSRKSFWKGSLSSDSVIAHVRAAFYTTHTSRLGYAQYLLLQAAFASVAAHVLGDPFMVVLMAGLVFGMSSVSPTSRPWLPLSRHFRARLAWSLALISNVIYAGALAALIPLAKALPALNRDVPGRDYGLMVTVVSVMALAPLIQWVPIRFGGIWQGKLTRRMVVVWLVLLVYIFATRGLAALATRASDAGGWAPLQWLIPAALLMQLLLWIFVQRYYRRGDLVER